MKGIAAISLTVCGMLLYAAAALANPQISIKVAAEKEMVVVKNGQKVTKMIPVKKVSSGEIIQYTLSYRNNGSDTATNVVISDPIPKGTVYIPGSATEKGSLTFSVDGGKTYNTAPKLSYEITRTDGKKEQRVAGPEQYSDIRWLLDRVAAGDSGKVSFKVKVQ